MAYSDFKTIEAVQKKYDLKIISGDSLFRETPEIKESEYLREWLKETVPMALNMNTEKARSELIIAPILVEIRKILAHKISLFSGLEFNVDETLSLSGYCDFIIGGSPNQIFLEFPVVCIVEAKNENIKSGYGQCIAEMVAAQIFNQRHDRQLTSILGVVTTGSNWKFLKYEDNTVFIDFDEYLLGNLHKIIGIFVAEIQRMEGQED